MIDIAGWIAPVATMIAAMMTAANLGARVTGWGFVVFVIGSLCWSAVGLSSGQTNLLATNLFLTLVNFVGIWRWLGRQRAYEDGGKSAEQSSKRSAAPSLFTATGIAGMTVQACDGSAIGKTVEALMECGSSMVSYVVVASRAQGELAERLRAVPRESITFASDRVTIAMSRDEFDTLVPLEDGEWPETARLNPVIQPDLKPDG